MMYMAEPIKLKNEELAEIRMLGEKSQEKLIQLGLLYVDKMQVEEAVKTITDKETKLQGDWNNLKKMENEVIEKLLKTYGEGALDLKNGAFIPDATPPATS